VDFADIPHRIKRGVVGVRDIADGARADGRDEKQRYAQPRTDIP
jgi:hypothetical protein